MEEFPENGLDDEAQRLSEAGFRCSALVATPETWINRRVETVELLSHEETRRRVSVDFTLPDDPEDVPDIGEGIAVPISVLTKQRRRHFDLRDESGAAIPVLGRDENSVVTHRAILGIALNLIDPENTPNKVFESISARLWGVVTEPPEQAFEIAASILHDASNEGSYLHELSRDYEFIQLLGLLVEGYLLFALIDSPEPRRRILKFSYGDDFDFRQRDPDSWWSRSGFQRRWSMPDGYRFLVDCSMAAWASSYHLEVAIPEELRARHAILYCENETGEASPIGNLETDVDRISLYAPPSSTDTRVDAAFVELIPERSGQIIQSFSVGILVTVALFAGSVLGLDQGTSDAAVSILLVGAAFFSGISASSGKHILVGKIFSGTRFATLGVAIAAIVGSLSLTWDISVSSREYVWFVAALISMVATLRLGFSARRAAR